jgi:hypothetical protein
LFFFGAVGCVWFYVGTHFYCFAKVTLMIERSLVNYRMMLDQISKSPAGITREQKIKLKI